MPDPIQALTLNPPIYGERDHILGPPDAPLTLAEYGDYECPHCGRAHPILGALRERFPHELRIAFRNFPLAQIHPHAQLAAEAAEAAGAQGRIWEMHDLLFENQDALDDESLAEYAERIGLDLARFARDLSSHAFSARVREDFLSGIRSGVNGTPTFFINGVRHDGPWDLETLTMVVGAASDSSPARHARAPRRSHR